MYKIKIKVSMGVNQFIKRERKDKDRQAESGQKINKCE